MLRHVLARLRRYRKRSTRRTLPYREACPVGIGFAGVALSQPGAFDGTRPFRRRLGTGAAMAFLGRTDPSEHSSQATPTVRLPQKVPRTTFRSSERRNPRFKVFKALRSAAP